MALTRSWVAAAGAVAAGACPIAGAAMTPNTTQISRVFRARAGSLLRSFIFPPENIAIPVCPRAEFFQDHPCFVELLIAGPTGVATSDVGDSPVPATGAGRGREI